MFEKIKKRLVKSLPGYAGSPCWEWTGGKTDGYGRIWDGKKMRPVHRVVYEFFRGKISGELVLDHLCRNRACCNPDHLQLVTNKENILRGNGSPAQNSKKTHCPKGHPLSGDNLSFLSSKKQRRCVQCHRDENLKYRLRKKEKELGITINSPA
jgi:HNH endonuclease